MTIFTAEKFIRMQLDASTLENLQELCKDKTLILVFFYSGKKKFGNELKSRGFVQLDLYFNLYQHPMRNDFIFTAAPYTSVATIAKIQELSILEFARYVHLGLAGSFSKSILPGDLFLTHGAFSESLTPFIISEMKCTFNPGFPNTWFLETIFEPTLSLTEKIKDMLFDMKYSFHQGHHYMTDFPFLENSDKFTHILEKGGKVVEMEGAAFFSITKKIGKESAALYIISDTLIEEKWIHIFDKVHVKIFEIIHLLIDKLHF